jgi:nitrous oxidase accessory protein NosD
MKKTFIENCVLEGGNVGVGIVFQGVNEGRVTHTHAPQSGLISMSDSHFNLVTFSSAHSPHTQAGVEMQHSNSNLIEDSDFTVEEGFGIGISNSFGNNINRCTGSSEETSGLGLFYSENTTVTHSSFHAPFTPGIWMQGGEGNLLLDSEASSAHSKALFVSNTRKNVIQRMLIQSGGSAALHLSYSNQNLITENRMEGDSGVLIQYSSDNVIIENKIKEQPGAPGFDRAALWIQYGSARNRIQLNTIMGNLWVENDEPSSVFSFNDQGTVQTM